MRLIYPSFLVATFLLLAMVAKAEASGCKAAHPWPYTRNTLRVGETLTTGESLESKTAKLILQSDGNLVLYRKKDNAAVWQTGTGLGQCNGTAAKLTMTATGFNLVDNTHTCWTTAFASPSQIAVVRDHCTFDVFTEAPYTNQTWNTGPARCIEAHIVPHSHDDVGWLLTPERYYDGCQTQGGGVRFIISTIVEALQQNPNRTFNQVESYFFNRWWKEQNETTKAVVKDLVASGQLVFLNGGWSMHDEACVHQESAISNMEVGARFLKEELGVELNIGWHIDPFGHASSTPRYMAEMGFDAFFFWRTDYEQRQHNLQTKQFEVVWHNSPSLGNKTKMFTSIMYNNYCMGCADKTCPSEYFSYWCEYSPHDLDRTAQLSSHHQNPVMTLLERQAQQQQKKTTAETLKRAFGASEVYSDIKALADMYVESVAAYEDAFRTGHVLMPWGCDFGHQAALEDYTLMDQLIDYVNDHYADYGVHMFYSTAQRYVKDVQAMNYQWPLNEFDYFLDSDGGHSYWSGYLSSRAEYKGFERELMNERTAVELVLSAVPTTDLLHANTQLARTQVMREALGVAQHHDSITGTERTWVRNQYQNILTLARNNITQVFDEVYNQSFGVETTTCRLANLSYCEATNGLATGASVSVYAFNPIAQQRTEIITVPVPVEGVSAYLMPGSTLLVSQVVTTWELTTTVDNTSPPVPSHHPYQLYVQVPLSAQSLVEIMLVANASVKAVAEVPLSTDGARIENEHYALKFNGTTGMLSSVLNKDTNVASPLTQSISRYCPYPSQPHEQASGAYIMRTCDPHSPLIPYATNFSTSVVSGPLCREVRQLISGENNMQQSVRVCNGQSWVEITSGIGEVKTYDTGVEVIMHIGTDVDSAGVWYTDSQALEMQQRVRDSRPNYPYTLTEPIASNFFPCNAFSYINSSSRASKNMAVMADRSRATASIVDGELQFLVQRRLIYDDNRGVGEPLDEHTRVLTTSRVVFNTNDLFRDMRVGSLQQTHKPVLRYGAPSHSSTPFQWLSRGSDAVLPPNVHLHTRTLLTPGVVLVRLQHLFAVGEGDLAVPVQVSLAAALPSGAFITNVTDMDMNGVMEASRLSRIDFPTCDNNGVVQHIPPRPIGGSSPVTGEVIHEVTLNPMEIRVLKIEYTVIPLPEQ